MACRRGLVNLFFMAGRPVSGYRTPRAPNLDPRTDPRLGRPDRRDLRVNSSIAVFLGLRLLVDRKILENCKALATGLTYHTPA